MITKPRLISNQRNTCMITKPRLIPNQYGFSRANTPLKPSSHHLFNTPCTPPHIAQIVFDICTKVISLWNIFSFEKFSDKRVRAIHQLPCLLSNHGHVESFETYSTKIESSFFTSIDHGRESQILFGPKNLSDLSRV